MKGNSPYKRCPLDMPLLYVSPPTGLNVSGPAADACAPRCVDIDADMTCAELVVLAAAAFGADPGAGPI